MLPRLRHICTEVFSPFGLISEASGGEISHAGTGGCRCGISYPSCGTQWRVPLSQSVRQKTATIWQPEATDPVNPWSPKPKVVGSTPAGCTPSKHDILRASGFRSGRFQQSLPRLAGWLDEPVHRQQRKGLQGFDGRDGVRFGRWSCDFSVHTLWIELRCA